ncbi:HNH endonuclease signature motif containing protein [Streptomyces flaveolus]|uniref:HNH endonuclease n=1 Tax=Streptomyces flaveolus TaxID=67297 RepID=UPI00331D893B
MAHKPKGPVRRARKRYAAHVFRYRCAYCRHRFASLDHATLDHIVPRCLWPTWSATALALACLDCNRRKADRFPLSIALLLAARYPVHGPAAVFTSDRSSVHGEPIVFTATGPTVHGEPAVSTDRAPVFTPPFTLALWRLLARLAHAHQSAAPDPQRSTPHQPESTPLHPTPERTAA